MRRFLEALRAGISAFGQAEEPSEYTVAGRTVRCPHCEHTRFAFGHAQLNTRIRTAFKVDWADPSAAFLMCAECGRIEWFAQDPERVTAG